MSNKILVTGADGFIGSHLVEGLVAQGEDVLAFVHYNPFNSWGWIDHIPQKVKQGIQIITGDICDSHNVRLAMKECSTVFHLAALIGIPYSYCSPSTYVDTNIKGTLNILQAARELDVDLVVHTSTSEVYGSAQSIPITEEHPLVAQSPYAATKIAADQLALSFYHSFETPVAIVRPFNTYGPRQSARAIIPSIIIQALNGQRKIKIGNLQPTRDFSFVTDIVSAFLAVMSASDHTIGQVINVGSSFEISINDLLILISTILNSELVPEQDAPRNRPRRSEINRLKASTDKIQRLTTWQPEYVGNKGLRLGITKTLDWFHQSENLARYKCEVYNV